MYAELPSFNDTMTGGDMDTQHVGGVTIKGA